MRSSTIKRDARLAHLVLVLVLFRIEEDRAASADHAMKKCSEANMTSNWLEIIDGFAWPTGQKCNLAKELSAVKVRQTVVTPRLQHEASCKMDFKKVEYVI